MKININVALTLVYSLAIWLVSLSQGNASGLSDLKPLIWDHRIIVAYDHRANKGWPGQLREFEARIQDRDIVWFVIGPKPVQTNYPGTLDSNFTTNLKSRLIRSEMPQVILIGKDGEVKDRSVELDLLDLFAQIDRMPMRRWEMQNR